MSPDPEREGITAPPPLRLVIDERGTGLELPNLLVGGIAFEAGVEQADFTSGFEAWRRSRNGQARGKSRKWDGDTLVAFMDWLASTRASSTAAYVRMNPGLKQAIKNHPRSLARHFTAAGVPAELKFDGTAWSLAQLLSHVVGSLVICRTWSGRPFSSVEVRADKGPITPLIERALRASIRSVMTGDRVHTAIRGALRQKDLPAAARMICEGELKRIGGTQMATSFDLASSFAGLDAADSWCTVVGRALQGDSVVRDAWLRLGWHSRTLADNVPRLIDVTGTFRESLSDGWSERWRNFRGLEGGT